MGQFANIFLILALVLLSTGGSFGRHRHHRSHRSHQAHLILPKGDPGIIKSKGDFGVIGHGKIGTAGHITGQHALIGRKGDLEPKGDIIGQKGVFGTESHLTGQHGLIGQKGELGAISQKSEIIGPKGVIGTESHIIGQKGYLDPKGEFGTIGQKGVIGTESHIIDQKGYLDPTGELGAIGQKGELGAISQKGDNHKDGTQKQEDVISLKGDLGITGQRTAPGVVG